MATTIKIGHASQSEHGTAQGTAGDSTKKEVCINNTANVSGNWISPYIVLRPVNLSLAENSAKACEAGCNNDVIGYSQGTRNTLYAEASKVDFNLNNITTACNTDCSAFMTVCAIAGGANITYGTNGPTTSTMKESFKQSGDYIVLDSAEYTSKTDYLRRGDILVKAGSHTIMVLEDGIGVSEDTETRPSGESTGSSTNIITLVQNIYFYALDITISNIKNTSATVSFNVLERGNGTEKIINDTDKWEFKLILKNMSSLKSSEESFKTRQLNIKNLTENTTYYIYVTALDSSDNIVFCSAPKIFTTTENSKEENKIVEFGVEKLDENVKLVDKVYIKIHNDFEYAIVHSDSIKRSIESGNSLDW